MLSVILASCEGERYIGAQLQSVLAQLGADDEIIVSDDASSDRTVECVRVLEDARITLIVNADRVGYVKNFERALSYAKGDEIFFCDQDDVWLPRKRETLSRALTRKACAVSDAIVVDGGLAPLHDSYFRWRKANRFSFARVFLKPSFIGATIGCSRRYLESILPFPADVPHDFWITANALWDGELEVIEEPLLLYRRHASVASVTATAIKRKFSVILAERVRLARAMIGRRLRRVRGLS